MTPRLRSMTVTADRTILILDRLGKATRAEVDAIAGPLKSLAAEAGLNGVGVFPFAVDLGDEEPSAGVTAYPDELDALAWAIGLVRGDPDGARYANALALLLDRLREAQA